MNCINFHCHGCKKNGEGIQVVSYNLDEIDTQNIRKNCTVGIHPWQSSNPNVDQWLSQLEIISQNPNVLAIGEIGLDRLKGGSLELQNKILTAQANIAKNAGKPIIIHCVRAWSELIKTLSSSEFSLIKKAIHGFRGKVEMAKQLTDLGYYISFGSILVNATPELAETLTKIPLNRVFFETDDSSMPIEEVYSAAADILDMYIEDLIGITENNFNEFFDIKPA